MGFAMAYYFATFVVILITHETIYQVKGQCTVQGCYNGDPLSSLVAEIQQLRVDLFDQLNKQVQSIHELQDTVMRNLQAVDRRFQEQDIYIKQVQSIHELFNESFQEMKNQHDTVITSLQAADQRRIQEHSIYIKQGVSIHGLLNETFREMKSLQAVDQRPEEHDICIKQSESIHKVLNETFQEMKSQHGTVMTSFQAVSGRRLMERAIDIKQGQCIYELLNDSFQEMKNQYDTVISSLQAVDRRCQKHDMIIKVRTQNLWKPANGSCESESQVWDCSDLKASGLTTSGVYEVCVRRQLSQLCTNAFCDMETDNGSSLVFQRRKDGSVDFNRNWTEYKQGFGTQNGEFWLGNEMLYLLTSKRNYTLRVDLEEFTGAKRYAEYTRFFISSSADNYTLTVSGYSGNAGDSLDYNNRQQFTTTDVDNDDYGDNCARKFGGAWWYSDGCFYANLNGIYRQRYETVPFAMGIHWYHWRNSYDYSLKATEMKLVPVV